MAQVQFKQIFFTLYCIFASSVALAAVLPEERSDILYHSYDGGEVEVNGPSILVRKNASTNTSIFYNYYVDTITSASLDVQVSGSKYNEERTEQTLGIDYLHGKTTMSLSVTDSTENDYNANTLSVSISQDFFGDLSTLSMGYSVGNDDISKRVTIGSVKTFPEQASITRQSYRVGLTQILSKDALLSVGFEAVTDEATEKNNSGVTLNNPYRMYSFNNGGGGRQYAAEVYPHTRTSYAVALRGSYHLSYRAALHGELKYFTDDWGIEGQTYAIGYTYPLKDWIFDFRYRVYSQTRADFYSDFFPSEGSQNFMARDKELSTFSNQSIGVTASYEFAKNGWGWLDKGSLNISLDHIEFSYDDFKDATVTDPLVVNQPLYSFGADVLQLYASFWY